VDIQVATYTNTLEKKNLRTSNASVQKACYYVQGKQGDIFTGVRHYHTWFAAGHLDRRNLAQAHWACNPSNHVCHSHSNIDTFFTRSTLNAVLEDEADTSEEANQRLSALANSIVHVCGSAYNHSAAAAPQRRVRAHTSLCSLSDPYCKAAYCMYISIYVCVCIYIYIYIHTYIQTYIHNSVRS
jgi:hypothetical protein